jgi:membrane protein
MKSQAQARESVGRLGRFSASAWRVVRICAKPLYEGNLTEMAAALSYRTIFALIPVLVLALVAASAFGFLDESQHSLREFLQASGFAQIVANPGSAASEAESQRVEQSGSQPEAQSPSAEGKPKVINVADYLERAVENVRSQLTFKRIGPVGAALFIWTALGLLSTVETSLNRVFGAAKSRSIPRRVLLYWSVMTLGPALLAVLVYAARSALAVAEGLPVVHRVVLILGWLVQLLVGIGVLAAIYTLVPNARVHRRGALVGATIAVLIWVVAKWAFGLYVDRLVLKGNLYGILGAFPLFMLWLYVSWVIFLFGAELARTAAYLGHLHRLEAGGMTAITPLHALTAAVAVARAYEAGQGPVPVDQITAQLGLAPEGSRALLDKLVAGNLLCAIHDGAGERFVLARPPALVPVAKVLEVAEPRGAPPALGRIVHLTLADILRRDELNGS